MNLSRPSFAPRHWGGWLVAALMWCIGHLPYMLGTRLVASLAPLMRAAMKKRVAVVLRNLEACFPDWDEAQRQALMRANFRSLAISLAEFSYAWTNGPAYIRQRVTVTGLEHLDKSGANGRGVILLTCHMTCLEMSGWMCQDYIDHKRLVGIYRPLKNPVIEWLQNTGRMHYSSGTIRKDDLRAAIRHLRKGGYLWYAPDMDFGPQRSEFLPFFGIQTATLSATQKLANIAGVDILPFFVRREDNDSRYRVQIGPPLEGVPSTDMYADLAECNRVTEAWIRSAPEQYWWVHRRFKTRPPGESPFYVD